MKRMIADIIRRIREYSGIHICEITSDDIHSWYGVKIEEKEKTFTDALKYSDDVDDVFFTGESWLIKAVNR